MIQLIQDDIYQAVAFYYQLAKEKYPDLSSFAIVTDESFDTFLIAVNNNEFFDNLKNEKVCDECYWNTAEWQDECFDDKAFNFNIENITDFLNSKDYDEFDEDEFLNICLNALKSIHNDKRVCVFVHITDFSSNQKLYDIVKELNGDEVAESYKNYYSGWG